MSDTWDTVGNTASDLASSAITDVGDTYQEILLQDTGISAPDGIGSQEWETSVTTTEPDTAGVELESYEPPTTDAVPGLDIA